MAAPSYTEDLTDIATGDELSGWVNFDTNEQGAPQYGDDEYPYIQGLTAVTQTCSKSKTLANMGYDHGSTISLPTDGAFLVWEAFSSPFSMDDYVGTITGTAGLSVLVGDDVSNFDVWYVGGSDKSPMPYGGFQCHAVNTTVARDELGAGTKTIDRYVGAQVALTAYPGKGEPHQVDVMRFGRCSAIFEEGEDANYAIIDGYAIQNDIHNNRWGLLQETAGGYLWQGRIALGTAGTAVDFRDSNVTIFIKWCPKVTANFNTIEVENVGSNVEMTGFQFIQLDISTASKGRWITTDDAPVLLTNCNFNDMDTFAFDSNTTIDSCTWTRCNQVTQNGSTIDISNFSSSTADETASEGALLIDDLSLVTDCNFTTTGVSGHAVVYRPVGAGPFNVNWDGHIDSGYAAVDGSTGYETIL